MSISQASWSVDVSDSKKMGLCDGSDMKFCVDSVIFECPHLAPFCCTVIGPREQYHVPWNSIYQAHSRDVEFDY